MPVGPRADTHNVPGHRLVPVVAACAILTCTCASASPALGGPVARAQIRHRRGHRRAGARRVRCARTSSFHASGGRPHQRRHRTSCTQRRASRPQASRRRHGRSHRAPAAANSSACPDSDLRPTEEDLGRIRAATLCLVNRERAGAGEGPLAPNARLEAAAQGHTEDMVLGGYFDHIGPRGDTPVSRVRAAGYIYSSRIGYEIGENIAWGTLWLATPRSIVAAWMASPGHRANILDTRFRDSGIGVSAHPPSPLAGGQAGAIYTQDFGVIITG
jgi:uncharacterized protein YkwD